MTIDMKENFEAEFYAAGVKFRPDWRGNLASLKINEELTLEPEPTNRYDKNAIKLISQKGIFLGYVPAKTGEALAITQLMERGMKLKATVMELALEFEPWTALQVRVEEVRDD
jgi:hypothetical protein